MNRKILSQIAVAALFVVALLLPVIGVAVAQDEPQAFLGIRFDPQDVGVVVTAVGEDTPAGEAGVQVGDVIIAVEAEAVAFNTISEIILSYAPGDTVTLTLIRNDEIIELDVTLGEAPRDTSDQALPTTRDVYVGISFEGSTDGLTIREVVEESPASEAGLQVGDIVTAVNDTAVENRRDVVRALAGFVPGDEIELGILRDDEALTLPLTLGERPARSRDDRPGVFFNRGDDLTLSFDGDTLVIEQLSEESALAEAGLQAGDRITAVNGEPLSDAMRLVEEILRTDEVATLTVERGDEILEIELAPDMLIGSLLPRVFPFEPGERGRRFDGIPGLRFGDVNPNRAFLGVRFVTLTEDNLSEYETSVTEGAYIIEVIADSPAAEAGLMEGDVVTAVNGDVVDAERTLSDRLFAYEEDDVVTLDVVRGDATIQLDVMLRSRGSIENAAFFGEGAPPIQFFGFDGLPDLFSDQFDFSFDELPFDFEQEQDSPTPNL